MEGGFSRRESTMLIVASYAAFASALIGLVIGLLARHLWEVLLFAINLVAIVYVKHLYASRLCVRCNVLSCPFNPRRKTRRP